MPYHHRDSMSRKLGAMRDARERRRIEGSEPRYPRAERSLLSTMISALSNIVSISTAPGAYIAPGRSPTVSNGSAVSAGRRCSPVFASNSLVYALPDLRVFLTLQVRFP
jgi:hypothetical protein